MFLFALFVAMLVGAMSVSVIVIVLPLHVYRYRAMLRHYDAMLVWDTIIPCLALLHS